MGLAAFQERLGHPFRDPELLQRALTHDSLPNEVQGRRSNERLEFLGDAVLELIVREALFQAHPDRREGWMTQEKRRLVRNDALAQLGAALGVDEVLEMGRGQAQRGLSDAIRADTFEALLGAVFLDDSYEAAKAVALRHLDLTT
ncbi:MAG: ribonuclease III family protein [Thermoplasmatota archaeon]